MTFELDDFFPAKFDMAVRSLKDITAEPFTQVHPLPKALMDLVEPTEKPPLNVHGGRPWNLNFSVTNVGTSA